MSAPVGAVLGLLAGGLYRDRFDPSAEIGGLVYLVIGLGVGAVLGGAWGGRLALLLAGPQPAERDEEGDHAAEHTRQRLLAEMIGGALGGALTVSVIAAYGARTSPILPVASTNLGAWAGARVLAAVVRRSGRG